MHTPFAKLIFKGRRFSDAAMPVEALPELAAYRDLVLAVARSLYLEQNPQRVRLPKGFEAGLQLVLDRVESGSVVPIISRVAPPQQTNLFGAEQGPNDIFEQARHVIADAIESGATGTAPAQFSADLYARFSSFGRTLRSDEKIILASPDAVDGVVYDRNVRRRLVLRAARYFEEEVELVGEVRAADKDAEGFNLRLNDGRKIPVRTVPLFLPVAVRSLEASVLVHVRGTGLFDADGQLQRVLMATDVSLAEEGQDDVARSGCPTPVEEQLTHLGSLRDGWLDGSGQAFPAESVEWATKLLRGLIEAFQLPTPYVYPTVDGEVRAEWSVPDWEVSLQLAPATHQAEALAARLERDEVRELAVVTREPGAESRLGRFLSEYLH
ncbi:MAG TPA: hypothetical protein VEB21_06370 [Terriglobales bacterium]|nr:hypothetical protein [Terriglobales bacterium]